MRVYSTTDLKSKALRITGKALVVLFSLVVAGMIALQTSPVQSWIVGKITASLDEKLGARISFGSVSFQPFNHVLLKDVLLTDKNPYSADGVAPADTILKARSIHASFSLLDLLSGDGINIRKIRIKGADAAIVQDPSGEINLLRVFSDNDDSGSDIDLTLDELSLDDSRIRFVSYAANALRLDAGLELFAKDISLRSSADGEIFAEASVRQLDIKQTDGAYNLSAKGKGSYKNGILRILGLQADDGMSRINAPSLLVNLTSEEVNAYITNSVISSESIAHFDSRLAGDPVILQVAALKASGQLGDINLALQAKELSSGMEASLSGSLTGLGTRSELLADIQLDRFTFSPADLDRIAYRLTGGHIDALSAVAPHQKFTLSGKLKGPMNRLDASALLSTERSGSASMRADLRNFFDDSRSSLAHIEINTQDLDLGEILEVEMTKPYTLHATLDARMSDSSDSYFADLSSHDPELDFDLKINAMIRKNGRDTLKVRGEVRNINLNSYVPTSMPLTGLSMRINAAAHILDDAYKGNIAVSDIILKSTNETRDAGRADFAIEGSGKGCRASLKSDMLSADFEGSSSPFDMFEDILCHTLKREAPILFDETEDHTSCSSDRYHAIVVTGETSETMPFFFPGLYINEGTTLELIADGTGAVEGSLSSFGIASEGYYARDISAHADNLDGRLSLYASISEIGVNDVFLQNDMLVLGLDDNRLSLTALYDNNSNPESKAQFLADAELYRNDSNELGCRIDMSESELIASGIRWSFAPASVTIEPDFTEIAGFRAECEDQLISINGQVSRDLDGQMEILVHNFKLNTFNPLLHPDYRMDGLADGKALIISPVEDSFNLMANMHSVDMHIGGRNFGNFSIASVLDPEENKLEMSLSNTFNEKVTLLARGSYDLDDSQIDISVHADSISLGCAEPLLVGIISEAEGFVSGDLHIGGNLDRLDLSSRDVRIEDGWFVVDYTHVPYYIDGGLAIDNTGLHFLDNPVKDRYGNKGKVSGKIGWDHYNDWNLGIFAEFTSAQVIDISTGADQMFNGNAFASGTASFTGPTNNVLCDINLRSSGQGTFVLPLDSYEEDSVIDLLSFKQKEEEETDNFLFMARKTKKIHQVADNLRFKIKLDITPDLLTNIEMDKSTGSAIVSRGNGKIDITASTSPEMFDINGDYTLESGDFHFVVLGVANRTFDIKSGSAVHFNGDIDDTDLDINASYITKASISNLIADTTAVATRRNVECGINIGNTLANPSLSFSINVPDLDPTMKARVEGALNTDDKVQKQFIALLVTGGFIPDDESGITLNSSNILYSNVAGIMAGQLNNILQKFNIPLDLGLSYQANEGGTDIFDVAVSTELFNNRVVVNGSVGNRDNTKRVGATSTTSDVVGDVDIEIKLDNEGQVRMNMFSHSADEYTNFLDNSQRNGVGITYQKEFNNIKEFFRDIFHRKKNAEPQPAKEVEMTTITME